MPRKNRLVVVDNADKNFLVARMNADETVAHRPTETEQEVELTLSEGKISDDDSEITSSLTSPCVTVETAGADSHLTCLCAKALCTSSEEYLSVPVLELVKNHELHIVDEHIVDVENDQTYLSVVLDTLLAFAAIKRPQFLKSCVGRWFFLGFQTLVVVLSAFYILVPEIVDYLCVDVDLGLGRNHSLALFYCDRVQAAFASMAARFNQTDLKGQFRMVQNMSDFNNQQYATTFSRYIDWRATTGTRYEPLLQVSCVACIVLCVPSLMATFRDGVDPADVLYPPLLERQPEHALGAGSSSSSGMEGNGLGIQMRRSRTMVQQVTCTGGITIGLMLWTMLYAVVPDSYSKSIQVLSFFLLISVSTFCTNVTVGMMIQIRNCTTLANMLVRCDRAGEESLEKRTEQKEKWGNIYRVTVASLHTWSRKCSPFVAVTIILFVFISIADFTRVVLIYVYSQKYDVMSNFVQSAGRELTGFFVSIFMLIVFLYFVGIIDARYKELHTLVGVRGIHLEDFQQMEGTQAAFILFGTPVYSETAVAGLRVLFLSVFLLIYSTASSVGDPSLDSSP